MRLHSKRANTTAYLWQNASNPTTEFPSLTENGWTTTGNIEWIEEAYPGEVELISRDEDNGENGNDYGSEVESSDDEDYDHIF